MDGKHKDALIHDWWYDKETNQYFVIIETLVEHQLRLIYQTKEELG